VIIRLKPHRELGCKRLATPCLALFTVGLQFLALVRLGFWAAGWKHREIAALLGTRKRGVI
jgi:hypothetical protein